MVYCGVESHFKTFVVVFSKSTLKQYMFHIPLSKASLHFDKVMSFWCKSSPFALHDAFNPYIKVAILMQKGPLSSQFKWTFCWSNWFSNLLKNQHGKNWVRQLSLHFVPNKTEVAYGCISYWPNLRYNWPLLLKCTKSNLIGQKCNFSKLLF